MKTKLLLSLSVLSVLAGCETIQTPQQRQQDAARQQAASRYAEERVKRLQGQVESIEMENGHILRRRPEPGAGLLPCGDYLDREFRGNRVDCFGCLPSCQRFQILTVDLA